MIRSILFIALATVSITACSKNEGGGGGGAKQAVKLPKVGLTLDAPGDTMVMDGMSETSHMVNNVSFGGVNIEVEKEPGTVESAKGDAEMFNGKNIKNETLSDGFYFTYDNTGSMGASYFVEVHRKIDGKDYKCSTTVSQPSQGKAALAACKTLKKG